MGRSPLAELRRARETGIQPGVVSNKHDNLIAYYEQDLSGVLRYMFGGKVVPLEIEDAVVTINRHLYTLAPGATLQTRNKSSITIQNIQPLDAGITDKYTVTFINTTGKQETIICTRTHDLNWGNFPISEITWQNTTYRSVPFHGDVRNHLHHQHTWYETEYLTQLLEANLITQEDFQVIHLYHQIHDLPEIIKRDKHADDKTPGDAQEESSIIEDMIRASLVAYTDEEVNFIRHSFRVFEQPTNFFKGGERFGYMLDALRTYQAASHYFHQHLPLVGDILRNQLPYFLDTKKTLRVTPLHTKPTEIPFGGLPNAHPFLEKHGNEIQQVLASGGYTDIQPLWDKIVSKYKL